MSTQECTGATERLLDPGDVAALMQTPRRTVIDLVNRGQLLEPIRLSRTRWRWREGEIVFWLRNQ